MAQGIADATHFYIRHGLAQRRLQALLETQLDVLHKWQAMIEVYLATQLHVLAGMGYATDEHGLTQYAQDLQALIVVAPDEDMDGITATRRETWRELVATAFGFAADDIPNLSIVQARDLMHKVSSKMVEPELLMMIQTQTATITGMCQIIGSLSVDDDSARTVGPY
jgi:hypothetical protein